MNKKYLESNFFFYFTIRTLIFLVIFVFASNQCFSQNMPVPENIQAALLPKVLKFSPNHSQKSKLRILIVYVNHSEISQNVLEKSISSSMEAKSIVASDLGLNIGKCDLVYFMPGTQKSASICKSHKVLSVTGISSYVEQGLISIAFGLQDNKPKIFVNLSSLGKEGQSLSSEILRITQVFE